MIKNSKILKIIMEQKRKKILRSVCNIMSIICLILGIILIAGQIIGTKETRSYAKLNNDEK